MLRKSLMTLLMILALGLAACGDEDEEVLAPTATEVDDVAAENGASVADEDTSTQATESESDPADASGQAQPAGSGSLSLAASGAFELNLPPVENQSYEWNAPLTEYVLQASTNMNAFIFGLRFDHPLEAGTYTVEPCTGLNPQVCVNITEAVNYQAIREESSITLTSTGAVLAGEFAIIAQSESGERVTITGTLDNLVSDGNPTEEE